MGEGNCRRGREDCRAGPDNCPLGLVGQGLSSCLTGDLPDSRQLGPLSIPDGHAAVLGDSLGPACRTG